MCGIVGYAGTREAAPIILDGLSKLEYRGYDSAGIAVRDGANEIALEKTVGRLKNLIDITNNGASMRGNCGIGHTRWATHGAPSTVNAHPHISGNRTDEPRIAVAGVHNGIIENYAELRKKLERHGYAFYSDTDTEVAVKLVDYYYNKYGLGPIDAIAKTMVRMRGSYALELMFRDRPGEIWIARKDSPLIVGIGEGEHFAASDVPAILKYTRKVVYVGNLEFACLTANEAHFYDLNGDEIEKEISEITWDAEAAEKDGYEHFMMKEIMEQPKAVRDTLNSMLTENTVDLSKTGLTDELFREISQLHIVACGSAWHAGMTGRYVIESIAKLPVQAEIASEFRYRDPVLDKNTLVVLISQSGETADTLAALRLAKEKGLRTLAIVNVVGSSVAREADGVLYTLAGPEISVATTKAYSAQLAALYCLAVQAGFARGTIDRAAYEGYIAALRELPEKIGETLKNEGEVCRLATKLAGKRDAFFIGRGTDYPTCLEGALKLKEVAYLHSEAYAAGELKHGTISLIEEGTPVIGVLTGKALAEKTLGNMIETASRGASLTAVTTLPDSLRSGHTILEIDVPETDPHFAGSLAVIPLQLLAYYTGCAKGLDVDKPRNLAKSVTVE
ncbi:MAG: glutamine--fructose-6-phosphate transaminase (isomerizing) [Clostridia bacterium]|nr:glutamine--fructose-6-phosphate transaminase (isomerizing) [Clostridia bacterium]